MKRLKKFSLVYALQVFGVIMLFGYPGCSSNIKGQKNESGNKDITQIKRDALNGALNKAPQVPHAVILMPQPEAAQINFASYLNFSK
ncbi:MAG: hypothetical protein ABIN74_14720 [Ferruginibacter sp.]